MCSSGGPPHTNILRMKGQFQSISRIDTAPVTIFLWTDMFIQTEPTFANKKSFWNKNTVWKKAVAEMPPSS